MLICWGLCFLLQGTVGLRTNKRLLSLICSTNFSRKVSVIWFHFQLIFQNMHLQSRFMFSAGHPFLSKIGASTQSSVTSNIHFSKRDYSSISMLLSMQSLCDLMQQPISSAPFCIPFLMVSKLYPSTELVDRMLIQFQSATWYAQSLIFHHCLVLGDPDGTLIHYRQIYKWILKLSIQYDLSHFCALQS